MNNNGQVFLYSIMLGLTIIVLVLAFAPAVKSFSDSAMNQSNLDCDNSSISSFDKATCVAVDVGFNFYFLGSLVLIGGGVIVTKVIFS